MAPVEQYSAIASFKFVGEDEVRRMAQAMQQAGLISEQGVARMISAAADLGNGVISAAQAQRVFVDAIGVSAAAVSELERQFQALSRSAASAPQGLRDMVALTGELNANIAKLRSGAILGPVMQDRLRMTAAQGFTAVTGAMAARGGAYDPVQTRLAARLERVLAIEPTRPRIPEQQAAVQPLVYEIRKAFRETRTGNIVGAGYDVYQGGEWAQRYRLKREAEAAVQRLQTQRTAPLALPEGPTAARVNARLERLLADQSSAQARFAGPPQALGMGPLGAAAVAARPLSQPLADAFRRAEAVKTQREFELGEQQRQQALRNASAMAGVFNARRAAIPDQEVQAQIRTNARQLFEAASNNLTEQLRTGRAAQEARQRVAAISPFSPARVISTPQGPVYDITGAGARRFGQAPPDDPRLPIPYSSVRAYQRRYQVYSDYMNIPPGGWSPRVVVPPGGYGGGAAGGGGGFGGGGFGGAAGDGGGDGFFSNFRRGFRGNENTPIATQLGQTARFSVYYGAAYKALFALSQTLNTAVQESVEFEQGMAQLNIATGRSSAANKQIAQNLGDIAASTGLSPSAGLDIGARAVGLYDLQGAPQQTQEAAMRQATRSFSQLQFTTGRTPDQLQLDVGAIGQAFNFGFQAMDRIADLDAFMTTRFGLRPGSTLETVAQSGSLGAQAGFSPEEVFAAAAKLQSRTGQTPAAVAGLLTQIFSRAGEGGFQQQLATLGVDVTKSFREQVAQLAHIAPTLSEGDRQRVTAAAGRGRSQGAFAALIEDFDEIVGSAGAAKTGAPGLADKQFEQRMQNVAGELARLSGAFKTFGVELGNAGLLQLIGVGVVALREFFQTTTEVLRVWNEIPGAARSILLAFGAVALAGRLGAGGALAGRLLGNAGLARASAIGSREAVLVNAAGERVAAGGLIAGARAAGARGSIGAVAGLFGGAPVIGAVATLTAIAVAKSTWDGLHAASRQATDTLINLARVDFNDPEQLGGAVQKLRESAKARRDLPLGADILSGLGFGFQRQANRAAATTEANAQFYADRQTRLEREANDRAANAPRDTSVFGDLSETSVSQGLQQLTDSGASAATRLRLLNAALNDTATLAGDAAAKFDVKKFANGVVSGLPEYLAANVKDVNYQLDPTTVGDYMGPLNRTVKGGDIAGRLTNLNLGELQAKLEQTAAEQGITSGALTSEQMAGFRNTIQAFIAPQLEGLPWDAAEQIRTMFNDLINKYLADKTAGDRAAQDPNRILSPAEQTQRTNSILSESRGAEGELARGDLGGRARILGDRVRQLIANRGRGTGNEQLEIEIRNAQSDFAEARIEQLQIELRLTERKGGGKNTAAKVRSLRNQMVSAAIYGQDPQALADVVSEGGEAFAKTARKQIESWYNAQVALAKTSQVVQNIIAEAAALMQGEDPRARDAYTQGKVDEYLNGPDGPLAGLKATRDALIGSLDAGLSGANGGKDGATAAQIAAANAAARIAGRGDTVGEARVALQAAAADLDAAVGGDPMAYANALKAYNEARAAYTAAQVDASKIANTNRAAFTGGDLSNARAELQNAALELKKYARGTAEYNQALGNYFQQQLAFAEAAREARSQHRLTRLDITDPVAEAREQQRVAKEALDYATKRARDPRSDGGRRITRDERGNIDRLYNENRSAEANAEAAAFQQKFNDMQIADQLGRVSHAAYIQYLQNESARLHAIHGKSRQQIDEMNQVDQALKAATDQMTGQFNLGDIKLPTPYEVRRYIQSTTDAQLVGASTSTGTTNNFYINGADTGQIETVVYQAVGAGSAGTFSTAAKKV